LFLKQETAKQTNPISAEILDDTIINEYETIGKMMTFMGNRGT
jgi:hypothetical protein